MDIYEIYIGDFMNKKEKKYCVYKHTNKFNGKVYIGITSQSPKKRWQNGLGYTGNEYFYRAILKYGWDDGFSHEIIVDRLSKDQACAIEIELIKAYDSTNPDKGYNFSTGGDCGNGGCSLSEEWRRQMSAAIGKQVICIENSIVYETAVYAEKETGIKATSIGAVCRGDYGHQTAGGLHWCFWDEEWNNFKSACDQLGFGYTKCDKCGVLIISKSNTKPKKYCGECSKRTSVGIKKKKQTIKRKSSKKTTKNHNCHKKHMGKRNTTK